MRRWGIALDAALGFVGLMVSLWFGVTGFRNGTVYSADNGDAALRTADPMSFWISEAFWLLLAGFSLLRVVLLVPLAWQYSLGKQIIKRAGRPQRMRAQIQETEAGRGPEPPWVRFPGPVDAFPEAETTAYFEDVFAPFWLPLGAEARAAYLWRHPPPNQEWLEVMAALRDLV